MVNFGVFMTNFKRVAIAVAISSAVSLSFAEPSGSGWLMNKSGTVEWDKVSSEK